MFSTKSTSLVLICILCFLSCTERNNVSHRIQEIRRTGDTCPDSALMLLHDLRQQINDADAHTLHTMDLLEIRLKDKAFLKAHNDKDVKQVLAYFERNGSAKERQEAYYYAGSVYRDLDDVPSSLIYFMKSTECAEQGEPTDSVLLRNSYSQLYALFFGVQDYSNALNMAKKEVAIAKELDMLDASTLLQNGAVLLRLDSLTAAKECIMGAFNYVDNENIPTDIYSLSSLLYQLSAVGCTEEAEKCCGYIKEYQKTQALPPSTYLALGKFYTRQNDVESAISCYDSVLQISEELSCLYDASRNLSLIYNAKNNTDKANQYAQIFISVSDTLNLDKRQTEASTTYNKYKYQKDQEEEKNIKEEKERYYVILVISSFTFVLIVLALIIIFTYHKNTQLKEILKKSHELDMIKLEKKNLEEEILQEKKILAAAKEELSKNDEEKKRMKLEMTIAENELKMAHRQLEDRLMQSKNILKLLHQTQFEERTEDILEKIHKAADGKYKMSHLDWKRFHNAVNDMYPDFAYRIVEHFGEKINDKQILFCELMRVGISNPQIQTLMDMPKATVWRWAKKYDWVISAKNDT